MVGSEVEVASGHVTEETIRQNISLFTLGIAKDFPEAGFSAGSRLPLSQLLDEEGNQTLTYRHCTPSHQGSGNLSPLSELICTAWRLLIWQ